MQQRMGAAAVLGIPEAAGRDGADDVAGTAPAFGTRSDPLQPESHSPWGRRAGARANRIGRAALAGGPGERELPGTSGTRQGPWRLLWEQTPIAG